MSKNFITETQRHRDRKVKSKKLKGKNRNYLLPFLTLCLCVSVVNFACKSQPTDLRTLAPAETLVYLEAGDLSKTLNALTENKTFQESARAKPDFSALGNVQFAVAVTGFEASEKQVTAENSVLNFKPHFVAIADTHAWNWQTISLAENQINGFVKNTYGDETTLEKSDKDGGLWFAWTAKDESRVFAFVRESLIYFGNDASVIEKCLAVKRGEADNLLKNESLSRAYSTNSENNLAFGYVSPKGVAQISNLAGVSVASEASEEAEGQSFIARVLPQILRGAVREIVWTARKSETKIEDKLSVSLNTETISVFKETLASAPENRTNSAVFLPSNPFSVTRYNLKNPLIAWRSLLLVSAKNADSMSGNLIIQFSKTLLASYGVADAEAFLSAIDSDILTAQFDAEGNKSVVIATVKDAEKLKKSLAEINFKSSPEKNLNADVWLSEDKLTAAAFVENKLILGDAESVLKCLEAGQNGQNFTKSAQFQKFAESNAVAVTAAKDLDSAEKVVEVLGGAKDENKKIITDYLTETRITEKGIERKSVSDFGFVGTILEKFEE